MWHPFDSVSGTNQSVHSGGGYALEITTGCLDAWVQRMIVVGRTRFVPDLLTNKFASKHNNRSDVWDKDLFLELAGVCCNASLYMMSDYWLTSMTALFPHIFLAGTTFL